VIPFLHDRSETASFGLDNYFVDYFVALHDGDWGVAEDHFAREVRYLLTTDLVDPRDKREVAMRLAVKEAAAGLSKMRTEDDGESSSGGDIKPSGRCPYCDGGSISKVGGE
jgi:hypothetical protein